MNAAHAAGLEPEPGKHSYSVCRRQFWPARQHGVGLHRRGRLDRQGLRRRWHADQAAVDPRGRHPRRPLSSHVFPQARSRIECAKRTHWLAARHRRAIHHGRHAIRRMMKDGIDSTSVEGAANIAYAIPNIAVDLSTTKAGVPVLWWRVVGSSHTTFAVEAFIDEVAHAAGADPLHIPAQAAGPRAAHERGARTRRREGRLDSGPLPKGKGRGIAVCEAFKSYVAQVAEVSVDEAGRVKVDRVVCAVDCGTADQSRHHHGANGRRHRLRVGRGVVRRDHLEGWTRRAGATSTTIACCA